MDGFRLLVGHLIGDYLLQTDWQAANKTNPAPLGDRPGTMIRMPKGIYFTPGSSEQAVQWEVLRKRWWVGHSACTLHCALYTLAVWACSFWWLPWWGLVVCFAAHWPVDRWRLARVFMW